MRTKAKRPYRNETERKRLMREVKRAMKAGSKLPKELRARKITRTSWMRWQAEVRG